MLKYKKDLRNCISRNKLSIPRYDNVRFYDGFLWKEKDDLLQNSIPDESMPDKGAGAACRHAPYFIQANQSGPAVIKAPRKLGELHFISGIWNMEVVSHECFHATMHICELLNIQPAVDIIYEEMAAYIHGELVDATYRWLWNVDPPRSYRKRASFKDWLISLMTKRL